MVKNAMYCGVESSREEYERLFEETQKKEGTSTCGAKTYH
jgi:hypothetical protein